MPVNMEEELFLNEIRDIQIYDTNPEIRAEAEKLLREMAGPMEMLLALNILLVIYYHDKRYDDAMKETELLFNDPAMHQSRAYLLLKQGEISQLQGDFDAALSFYCRSLTIGKWPEHVAYFLWSHISFCWLYKRQFVTAEWCARKAISISPKRWEAWKNLGAGLELQEKYPEALRCYFKAVFLADKKMIPILHLHRLIRRRHGFIDGLKEVRKKLFKDFKLMV